MQSFGEVAILSGPVLHQHPLKSNNNAWSEVRHNYGGLQGS